MSTEPRRRYRAVRSGFHWRERDPSAGASVQVPSPPPPNWPETYPVSAVGDPRPIAAADLEQALATMVEFYGRSGREPVTHVDVDVALDKVATSGRLDLRWAGLLLATCTEHESWTAPALCGCELKSGALVLRGDGPQRQIVWDAGTIVRVVDVPITSLRDEPADAYTVVASSDDDPDDELRRQAHAVFGARYHSDIPPCPADARPGFRPLFDPDGSSLRRVEMCWPSEDRAGDLLVDDEAAIVFVTRVDASSRVSGYAVPLTAERAVVLEQFEQRFMRSLDAYADVGTDPDAAAILAGTTFTPALLYDLLDMVAVRDLSDASALLARAPEQWDASGWPISHLRDFAGHCLFGPRDPDRVWRVADAVKLADAGIGADRAYELRTSPDGRIRTVEDLIAEDSIAKTDAGRLADRLLDDATDPVPADVARALAAARTATETVLESWDDGSRAYLGHSSGDWVTLTRHTFVLREGKDRALYAVLAGEWYSCGGDFDSFEKRTTYLDELAARKAWRALHDARRAPTPTTDPSPCSCAGPSTPHCDHCGATEPSNVFLPELGWMTASLGRACGPTCYDYMSDRHGTHAERFHHGGNWS